MGELLIVSRAPCEKHPEGRHYVTQTIEATLEDTVLVMKGAIVALGNSYEEAKTIVENIK